MQKYTTFSANSKSGRLFFRPECLFGPHLRHSAGIVSGDRAPGGHDGRFVRGWRRLISVQAVAQQADGEGAGAVDDLSPVGSALFEDCDRLPGCRHGDPHRADGLFRRAARRSCDSGGGHAVVGACRAADSLGHLAGHLFAHGAVAGDVRGVDAQQFGF